MKLFAKNWTSLTFAVVVAWSACYFATVASAAEKPERISVAHCADCVQFHFQDRSGNADGLIIDMWRRHCQTKIIGLFFLAEWLKDIASLCTVRG
jgi:hypothetical protein